MVSFSNVLYQIYYFLIVYAKETGGLMDLETTLKSLINNINYPFKEAVEIETALKKRLTKKEFKLLKELTLDPDEATIKEHLGFDNTELERVKSNLTKKLNQEQTKQLLYNYVPKQ